MCRVCIADKLIFEKRDEKKYVDSTIIVACGGTDCAKPGFKCVCAGSKIEKGENVLYISCGGKYPKPGVHHPACLGRALAVHASTQKAACKLMGEPILKGVPRLVVCSPKHNGSSRTGVARGGGGDENFDFAESGMLACGWCPGLMGKLSDLLEPTGSLPTTDFGSEAASGMGRRRRTRACGSWRGARTSRTARGCVTGTARAADTLSREDSGRPSHLLQPGGGRS